MSRISIEDRVRENERQITELMNDVATLRTQLNEFVRECYE
jgi:regulator of replication initiation timing